MNLTPDQQIAFPAQRSAPATLAHRAYDAIVAHARAGLPDEVCGVVCGRGLAGTRVLRGRNIALEPTQNYELDAATLMGALEAAEAGALCGFYHSHPVTPAYPSAVDAWSVGSPDWLYLICSLQEAAPVIRAFRMQSHRPTVRPTAARLERGTDDPDSARLTLPAGSVDLRATRPGGAVFAAYRREPAGLAAELVGSGIDAPVYVMCSLRQATLADLRVVSIWEHPLEIVADNDPFLERT